jgi:hypothetical protein
MGEKYKIRETTSIEELEDIVESLRKTTNNEIDLQLIRKIVAHLGGQEMKAEGSIVRFHHPLLEDQVGYTYGLFSTHQKHKGGNERFITSKDYKHYLYRHLALIIALKKKDTEKE